MVIYFQSIASAFFNRTCLPFPKAQYRDLVMLKLISMILRPIVAGSWVFVLSILIQGKALAVNFDHTGDFDYASLTQGHEVGCLAMNIYHEGRGESAKGRAAIAAVTMNRVAISSYPDTVCEVVWQRKQFSWTKIAARHHVIRDLDAWHSALVMAQLFIDGATLGSIGQATHYHADHVAPYWAATEEPIGKVGGHYFYLL